MPGHNEAWWALRWSKCLLISFTPIGVAHQGRLLRAAGFAVLWWLDMPMPAAMLKRHHAVPGQAGEQWGHAHHQLIAIVRPKQPFSHTGYRLEKAVEWLKLNRPNEDPCHRNTRAKVDEWVDIWVSSAFFSFKQLSILNEKDLLQRRYHMIIVDLDYIF